MSDSSDTDIPEPQIEGDATAVAKLSVEEHKKWYEKWYDLSSVAMNLSEKDKYTAEDKRNLYRLFVKADERLLEHLPPYFLEALKPALYAEKRPPFNTENQQAWEDCIQLEANAEEDPDGVKPSALSLKFITIRIFGSDKLDEHKGTLREWRKKKDYQAKVKQQRKDKLKKAGLEEFISDLSRQNLTSKVAIQKIVRYFLK